MIRREDDPSAGRTASPNGARFSYPVFLDLDDALVLVVGGGRIGARKADGLATAGARVRLVASVVSDHVARSAVAEIRARPFEPADLDDVRLVITATGDVDTDRRISRAARERGIWVNAADQPVDCGFILPAIARSGRVTAAISTDGASPALAGHLRNLLVELLDDRVAAAAETLAAERAAVRAGGGSTEDVDWLPRIVELLGRTDVEASSPPIPGHVVSSG